MKALLVRRRFLVVLLAVIVIPAGRSAWGAVGAAPLELPPGETVLIEAPELPRFGLWATRASLPAPTLIVFSATIEESLKDPYYRQCGNILAEQGYLLVSLDLPGHGNQHRTDEPGGLAAWRFRSDTGEDFVTPFTSHVTRTIDYLIETGHTDPQRIAACGTSRGGFIALQCTAADPRIKATAAFAPVTDLMALREFEGAENTAFVARLSLLTHAKKLAGRSLWLVIGDRDERVSTEACIAFARQVTKASLGQGDTADVTLIVQPEPKGHTTPQGAPEAAAAWIADRLK
jgi:dienelactone hydrolase